MADFLSDISASRDRITKMLNSQSTGFGDVNDALSSVVAGKSSFGDAMNAIKAHKLKNEMGLYGMLAKEQASRAAEEDRDLAREQTAADRAAAREQTSSLADRKSVV